MSNNNGSATPTSGNGRFTPSSLQDEASGAIRQTTGATPTEKSPCKKWLARRIGISRRASRTLSTSSGRGNKGPSTRPPRSWMLSQVTPEPVGHLSTRRRGKARCEPSHSVLSSERRDKAPRRLPAVPVRPPAPRPARDQALLFLLQNGRIRALDYLHERPAGHSRVVHAALIFFARSSARRWV